MSSSDEEPLLETLEFFTVSHGSYLPFELFTLRKINGLLRLFSLTFFDVFQENIPPHQENLVHTKHWGTKVNTVFVSRLCYWLYTQLAPHAFEICLEIFYHLVVCILNMSGLKEVSL